MEFATKNQFGLAEKSWHMTHKESYCMDFCNGQEQEKCLLEVPDWQLGLQERVEIGPLDW